MSGEWIDEYNKWVKERYQCAGCYHYRGQFIRLPHCHIHGSQRKSVKHEANAPSTAHSTSIKACDD